MRRLLRRALPAVRPNLDISHFVCFLINTVASARWKVRKNDGELFQQFASPRSSR